MFLGTFQLKLDDKGRLSIPTRYRDILKEKYPLRSQQDDLEIILCYIGPHISAYPRVEWDRLADALSEAIALPGLHQDARNLEHMLFGNAAECPIDSQGRVVIPPPLRTKGKLNSEITMLAALKKLIGMWLMPMANMWWTQTPMPTAPVSTVDAATKRWPTIGRRA